MRLLLTTLLFVAFFALVVGGKGGRRGSGGRGGNRPPPRPRSPPARPPSSRSPASRCPAGWTLVHRRIGGWCVRIYQGVYNQVQAESACNGVGAVLSGIESAAERQTIAELGKTLMTTSSAWKYGTLRLGLSRPSLNSDFAWSDPNVSGWAGIEWSPLEPSGGSTSGYGHNCGLMWLWVPGGGAVYGASTRIHGTLFSMVCPITWNDRFRGFVCGRRAT
ncbi:unnamed protein product [Caenorhabditis sp. 36 PRJEB53466]|nr:unnamed protein product [Caenorhabditis sp. 36 PRJEB53466]